MQDLYQEASSKKNPLKKKVLAPQVLIRPLVTEKATDLGALNQYVFIVSNRANKISISRAIEELYGYKPLAVNIIKNKGKKVSRGRITGKRKDFKKAIVTLEKGKTISLYEGV